MSEDLSMIPCGGWSYTKGKRPNDKTANVMNLFFSFLFFFRGNVNGAQPYRSEGKSCSGCEGACLDKLCRTCRLWSWNSKFEIQPKLFCVAKLKQTNKQKSLVKRLDTDVKTELKPWSSSLTKGKRLTVNHNFIAEGPERASLQSKSFDFVSWPWLTQRLWVLSPRPGPPRLETTSSKSVKLQLCCWHPSDNGCLHY